MIKEKGDLGNEDAHIASGAEGVILMAVEAEPTELARLDFISRNDGVGMGIIWMGEFAWKLRHCQEF